MPNSNDVFSNNSKQFEIKESNKSEPEIGTEPIESRIHFQMTAVDAGMFYIHILILRNLI